MTSRAAADESDRALGALLGVAIGDALGMPAQTLPRERIRKLYGVIVDFVEPSPDQPVSAGLPAASVTDDTEQTLLLAAHLIRRHGCLDERAWADELLAWESDTRLRNVNDLLGPSTKRALEALRRGVPAAEVGRGGATNGAAMRAAPIGVATPLEPLDAFVRAVAATCRLTHNSADGIGAAVAVAAVVSAGISGASFESALPIAIEAARLAPESRAGSIPERIEAAVALAEHGEGLADAIAIAERVGVSVAAVESVPMAFAIARLARGDAWKAAQLAANIGDDTDTIGAIAAGMCGACSGASRLPEDKVRKVVAVNKLDLAPVVDGLLKLRHASDVDARGCP